MSSYHSALFPLCVRSVGEKPFNCPSDGCEKTFSSQYSLKSHIRGHDKGQPFSVTLTHPLSEVSHRTATSQCRRLCLLLSAQLPCSPCTAYVTCACWCWGHFLKLYFLMGGILKSMLGKNKSCIPAKCEHLQLEGFTLHCIKHGKSEIYYATQVAVD